MGYNWVFLLFNKYFLHIYNACSPVLEKNQLDARDKISGTDTDVLVGTMGRQARRSSCFVRTAIKARLSVRKCWVWADDAGRVVRADHQGEGRIHELRTEPQEGAR